MMTAEDIQRLKDEIKAAVLEEVRAELFPAPDLDEVVSAINRRDKKFIKAWNKRRNAP